MKPNLGIFNMYLHSVNLELNKLLADETVLYINTRNYYWNIDGPNFHAMQLFFGKQYRQIDEIMDQIAERIRIIGHYTESRLGNYLKLTNFVEATLPDVQKDELKILLDSHETIIRNLRKIIPLFIEKYNDIGSSEFATQLLTKHEKMAWMIRVYLI